MHTNTHCIVIPIFKSYLTNLEVKSLGRAFEIFKDKEITLVHPETLEISFYEKLIFSKKHRFTKFLSLQKKYFTSIRAYNELMLSTFFYKHFEAFKFVLIYQTDCYIFKDELAYWCNKNYDYLGGIWFQNYKGNPENGYNIWKPGNGGFSLRKVQTFILLTNSRKPFYGVRSLFKLTKFKGKSLKHKFINFLKIVLGIFGYRNNLKYLIKNNTQNEDVFIMEYFTKIKKFKTSSPNDALLFSWDRRPDYLYKLTSQLPMGAHAWFRDDSIYEGNKTFWSNHIQ